MKKILAVTSFVLLAFACGEPAEEATTTTDADVVTTDVVIEDVVPFEIPADIATNPEAILLAATDAVLAVQSASYQIQFEGYVFEEDTTNINVTGEVTLQKGPTTEEALISVSYVSTFGEDVVSGQVVTDGTNVFFMDTEALEFQFGTLDMGGDRLMRNAPQGAVVVEYLITTEPFGSELNAAGYEILEQEEIEGDLCHVVAVQMPPYTSTWWIDAETYLPRANQMSVQSPDGLAGMLFKVTYAGLSTDIQPDPSVFQLECPEGYSSQEYVGAVAEGSVAPLWTLPTPDGGSISLEDLRGKVVIMDFWATWCAPCREVMPGLQELHETYGDELVVIGVNTWEQEDPAAFMAENGYTYPIVIQGDEVAAEYFVEGIPTFYVIAQDGTVAFHAVGADPANEEALAEILETLLGQ